MIEVDVEAMVKEAAAQIASLAAKNLSLAGQLSAALRKIAALEDQLKAKAKRS